MISLFFSGKGYLNSHKSGQSNRNSNGPSLRDAHALFIDTLHCKAMHVLFSETGLPHRPC